MTENGALIPNIKFADGSFLYDAISGKFSVIMFTQNGQVPENLISEINALKQFGIPAQLIALAIDDQKVKQADISFTIDPNIVKDCFFADVNTIYLVRPGHHINGRWLNYRENAITETFHQFTQVAEGVNA